VTAGDAYSGRTGRVAARGVGGDVNRDLVPHHLVSIVVGSWRVKGHCHEDSHWD
jgi:hypothetical protein